jgi:hypothetical protein
LSSVRLPAGGGDAEQMAKAVDEALRIGELTAAGVAPLGDELVDIGGVHHAVDDKAQGWLAGNNASGYITKLELI